MLVSKHSAIAILILTAWTKSSMGATGVVDEYALQFDQVVEQVRKGDTLDDSALWKMPPERLLTNNERTLKDPSLSVRIACIRWLRGMLVQNKEAAIRSATVKALLKVARDDADVSLSHMALSYLVIAKDQDFDAESKKIVEHMVVEPPNPAPDAIRLAGIIGGNVIEDRLATLRSRPEERRVWYGTIVWASNLAMARLGDATSIAYCVDRVKGEKDVVLRAGRLFNDMVYMHNPAGVALLKDALFSEERLPPVINNVPGTLIAQYALDLLAQIIEEFPIKRASPGGYSPEQLETARQWMQSHPELKIIK